MPHRRAVQGTPVHVAAGQSEDTLNTTMSHLSESYAAVCS